MAGDDLTSLGAVKTWLGLDDAGETQDDALLSGLITSVSQFIRNWCARTLTLRTFTEVRDGTNAVRLRLAETPIAAVSSLVIDGQAVPPGDLWASVPGYCFTDTMLILNGYLFTRGHANVIITYEAGFATVPPDLAQACVELVGQRFRDKDRIGLVSKGMAGETTQFSQSEMPASVRAVLMNFRRVVPV